MTEASALISVEEARKVIREKVVPLRETETVGLAEAVFRVIAEEIYCDGDIPPFHRCNMDGFAVNSLEGPGLFEILEIVPAGGVPKIRLERGQASKVMTGAPLPAGADAVVPIERTAEGPSGKVAIPEGIKPGENITSRGLEIKKGDLILKRGTQLRPQEISMLAMSGCPRPVVFRLPTVSIFSTGSELIEPEDPPDGVKVRNSNSYGLMAQCRSLGLTPSYLGIVRDDRNRIREKIEEGLLSDVLLLTGGVSVGDFDFVPELLRSLGVTFWFKRVRIKPGKPAHFGATKDGRLVFGLPGNPVSTMVIFEKFVRLALKILMGLDPENETQMERGVLRAEFGRRDTAREEYLPVFVQRDNDNFFIDRISYYGSGHMMALTKANALMKIREGTSSIPQGSMCEFSWLGRG